MCKPLERNFSPPAFRWSLSSPTGPQARMWNLSIGCGGLGSTSIGPFAGRGIWTPGAKAGRSGLLRYAPWVAIGSGAFLIGYGLLGKTAQEYVYWQQFIPGNEANLRITVIGDRFAYAFWRNDRVNDFRASGSGRIDFQRPVPEGPLRYCMELNRRLNFDSMAYDVLFEGDRFLVSEMSYAYVDSVLHDAPGHYRQRTRKIMPSSFPNTYGLRPFG